MIRRVLTTRWATALLIVSLCLLGVWILAEIAYRPALIVGLGVGFVSAVWFLIQHRPAQWWRIEAINASALALALAILYGRSLALLVITWPPRQPESLWQACFSIGLLTLVDIGLVVNLVLFRRFKRGDQAEAEHIRALVQRIADLEAENTALRDHAEPDDD